MTTIATSKVTIYQANGKGRRFHSKAAAYRSAAWQRVTAECDKQHLDPWHERGSETCLYCSKECDGQGRTNGKRTQHFDGYTPYTDDGYTCEADPSHSYRYRLIGRLARWLRWRDERVKKGKVT